MTKKGKKAAWPLKVPSIAGVITGGVAVGAVKKAVSYGADCLEIRVDTFTEQAPEKILEQFKKLKGLTRLPVLLTIRSVKEGGKNPMADSARAALFEALMPFADMVDIELSSGKILKNVVNFAKRNGRKVIASYHDFKKTPGLDTLEGIIEKGRSVGADAVKIAAAAQGPRELKRLARVLSDSDDLIVIAMGGYGAPSRIFFPLLGSLLTYGSVTGSTAPGQMELKSIKNEFRRFGIV